MVQRALEFDYCQILLWGEMSSCVPFQVVMTLLRSSLNSALFHRWFRPGKRTKRGEPRFKSVNPDETALNRCFEKGPEREDFFFRTYSKLIRVSPASISNQWRAAELNIGTRVLCKAVGRRSEAKFRMLSTTVHCSEESVVKHWVIRQACRVALVISTQITHNAERFELGRRLLMHNAGDGGSIDGDKRNWCSHLIRAPT